MKYIIAPIFIVAVIVGSQYYLFNMQKIQISALALQLDSEQKQSRNRISSLQEQLAAMQISLGLLKTEYASAREAQFRALRDRLDATLNQQSSENLKALRDQVDEVINTGALFQDHTLISAQAFSLAENARINGERDLAAIYYLNAINHSPSDFRLLKSYSELVMDTTDTRLENIARLRSVLQLSMYQIPPESVADLLLVLNKVDNRETELLVQLTPAPEPINWKERLEALATEKEVEESYGDSIRLAKLVNSLSDIVDSLREEQPESELLDRAEAELDLSQRVLHVALLTSTIDVIVEKLRESTDNVEKAFSLLQTGEASLGQIWEIDDTGFPSALLVQVDAYPKTFKNIAKDVANEQSKEPLKEIDSLVAEVNTLAKNIPQKSKWPNGELEKNINKINKKTEDVITLAKNVSATSGQENLRDALEDLHQALTDAQRSQFASYQRWAIEKAKSAFVAYDEQIIKTSADMIHILKEKNLAEIDQALLTPETGSALRDVLGKLTAKADGETAFEMQKIIAETKKKGLSDF